MINKSDTLDKYVDLKEFMDKGYLQEINRLVLHPCGMSMTFQYTKKGVLKMRGILDRREDDAGIWFDLDISNDQQAGMILKQYNVMTEIQKRCLFAATINGDSPQRLTFPTGLLTENGFMTDIKKGKSDE